MSINNKLLEAVESYNMKQAKFALRVGANPNLKDSDGLPYLHIAVEDDQHDMVQLLLCHGADVNAVCSDGVTALHKACIKGFESVVELLLKHKANVDLSHVTGNTAITMATYNGHIKCVKLLLEHGANVNAMCTDGLTAIHTAIAKGTPELVKILLDAGSKIENDSLLLNMIKYRMDNPPSPDAEKNIEDYSQIVKLLKEKGIDVSSYVSKTDNLSSPAEELKAFPLNKSTSDNTLKVAMIAVLCTAAIYLLIQNRSVIISGALTMAKAISSKLGCITSDTEPRMCG